MKQFLGWNLSRILFLVIGVTLIIQSLLKLEWIGIILGLYLCVMGIFKLGCASGSCNVMIDKQNKNDK